MHPEHMKTERYRTNYFSRPLQRGSVDGVGSSLHSRPATRTVHISDGEAGHRAARPRAIPLMEESSPHSPLPGAKLRAHQQDSSYDIGPVSFHLPSYEPPARLKLVIGKRKKLRRTIAGVVAVLIAMVMLTAGVVTWRGYKTASKVLGGSTTVAALASEKVEPTLLKGEGDGRVNILLLGIGGPNHDGGDLTDTMILASVDPVNHDVTLLSIPRDLWVKMPSGFFGASQKINAAYSAGKYQYLGKADSKNTNPAAIQAGLNNLDTVVGEVLGINVNYHVLVNFEAFAQAVDTVDGVTVDVKRPLVDASMAWENHNNPVLAAAGVQQMDGKEALLYARSRHSTSDFDRSERQRQILVAIKQKVLTLGTFSNPIKLDGLSSAFGKNVYSDLSTKAALRLYEIMKQVDNSKIESLDLVTPPHSFVTTDNVNNISVVRPKLGFDTYSQIQSYVRSELRDGYIARENAKVVVAASTQPQATSTMHMLQELGYNCQVTVLSTASHDGTTVIDLTGGKAPYTRNYLEKRYSTTAISTLPKGLIVPDGTQFVILVK